MALKQGSTTVISTDLRVSWDRVKNTPDSIPTGQITTYLGEQYRTIGSGNKLGAYSWWGWNFASTTSFYNVNQRTRYNCNCNCSSNCNCYC